METAQDRNKPRQSKSVILREIALVPRLMDLSELCAISSWQAQLKFSQGCLGHAEFGFSIG